MGHRSDGGESGVSACPRPASAGGAGRRTWCREVRHCRALSQELNAVYLKIDAIEGPIQASRRLRDSLGPGWIQHCLPASHPEPGTRKSRGGGLRNPIPTTRHAGPALPGKRCPSRSDRNHLFGCERGTAAGRKPPRYGARARFPNWHDVMHRRVDPGPKRRSASIHRAFS